MYPGESLYKQDKLDTLVIRSRIPTAFTSTLLLEMVTKIKIKPEEVQPSTSGGAEQAEEQVKGVESEESYDSDEIDEFLSNYCETAEIPYPMTISKELFCTNEMVARNYARLSRKDQERFDQMKELAEAIKKETGDYSLIEDMMARVVGERDSVECQKKM